MDKTDVDGIVFDLDNTLLDRQSTFFRVAQAFWDEHLQGVGSAPRDEASGSMIRWDEDGYSNREAMLRRWLAEWPGTGFTLGSLTAWYRSTMTQKVQPDAVVNGLLMKLSDRALPWGIVTNGSVT